MPKAQKREKKGETLRHAPIETSMLSPSYRSIKGKSGKNSLTDDDDDEHAVDIIDLDESQVKLETEDFVRRTAGSKGERGVGVDDLDEYEVLPYTCPLTTITLIKLSF